MCSQVLPWMMASGIQWSWAPDEVVWPSPSTGKKKEALLTPASPSLQELSSSSVVRHEFMWITSTNVQPKSVLSSRLFIQTRRVYPFRCVLILKSCWHFYLLCYLFIVSCPLCLSLYPSFSLFSILCFLYSPAQVVQLKTTVRSVKIPSTSFRAACASWASTTSQWTWLWCSKGCWETTASCRSTCAASLTGQNHQNPCSWSTTDPWFNPPPAVLRVQGLLWVLSVVAQILLPTV